MWHSLNTRCIVAVSFTFGSFMMSQMKLCFLIQVGYLETQKVYMERDLQTLSDQAELQKEKSQLELEKVRRVLKGISNFWSLCRANVLSP